LPRFPAVIRIRYAAQLARLSDLVKDGPKRAERMAKRALHS